ncbi:hypothetical protein A3A79_02590 [Candidatus Gottesmanbacteria bacterium RIFCSPLOWO2_01_FULL_43_11b]|uniref:RNase H type-1 domain-containing protein n=1 Tax=Candidatus Gottesmanbacteria bacterium RIFCSPLOWO2_01_FULL_43_11b TaxID=1798392 RepID=A0A1F6AH24_9BACT|nr:MAG: hypothetical protein A3A79_02590 [Candidatus Gottesmanbacteria bacterium RIFCSPLOWO2_01_FULL_43_11b]
MNITIHTDGGARGNPGPAAIGIVIDADGKKTAEFGKKIGEATNNVAEYTAVLEALRYLKNSDKKNNEIQFFIDSTLVVNQLNGKFKVKEPTLRELLTKIRILEVEVGGKIFYHHIPREQNTRADHLVNQTLDALMLQ